MVRKAREVRLKPKVRTVLEARCRAPSTAQRDVKRARIVLLAAAGRSTRSIAAEVGVQPRVVSNWRRRFAEHGLGGLQDRPKADTTSWGTISHGNLDLPDQLHPHRPRKVFEAAYP